MAHNLKVGDKIPGGRVSHYYAEVCEVHETHIVIRYNGDVRTVKILNEDVWRVL